MAFEALVKVTVIDVVDPETARAVIAVGALSGDFSTVSVAAVELAAVVVPLIAFDTTTR